jgi:hypothetical protein
MALAKMMMPLSGEGNQLFRVPSIFLLFVSVHPVDEDTFY